MSIENISNDKIGELPFGKGRFVLNDGRVMDGIWKGWKLVSGKTTKNGRVLSVKIKD